MKNNNKLLACCDHADLLIPSVLVAVIAAPLRKPKAIRSLGGFWKDIGRADFRRTDLLTVIHIIIQFNRDTPCFQPLRVKLFDITGNPSVERVAGSRAVRLCVPAEQLRTIRCIPAFTVVSVRPYDLFAVFTAVIKQLTVGIKDKAIARVVQLGIYCDGVEATSYSGDGVILCTPTGSTAYSMSAGGPIVEPSAKNFLITPICAHAMLAKSIVVAPSRVVTVKVGKIGRHNAFLSVDGGRAFRLNTGDEIVVKSSQKVTRLVRLKDTSFFEILNRKFIDKMR